VTASTPPAREATATYRVVDREILLPAYRRILVDPLLPLIPRGVDPNLLTHLGHLSNLAAVVLLLARRPQGGWPLVAAMLLLNGYVWLDNADGGHARRTGRASLYGEVLDHGLDVLNAAYMGLILALGAGAGPGWMAAFAAACAGSMAINLWEQAQTGVLQLGRIQQLEFAAGLSLFLVASAHLGVGFAAQLGLGPVTLQDVIFACIPLSAVSGMVESVQRVHAQGHAWAPLVGFAAFLAACVALAACGLLAGLAASAIATAAAAAFGARMLASRVAGEKPRVDLSYTVWTALLGAAAAVSAAWRPSFVPAVAAVAGLHYAVAAARTSAPLVRAARRGIAPPPHGAPAR
jgi:phosphatidylglycerophosphate synthase